VFEENFKFQFELDAVYELHWADTNRCSRRNSNFNRNPLRGLGGEECERASRQTDRLLHYPSIL